MGRATRRRGTELEAAILVAAWDVLVEQGYAGFTYEAVAARAATSRPVLYRRWPARSDLVLATVGHFLRSHPIAVPDTGRLRDDAIGLLRNANATRARTTALVLGQLTDFFRETGTNLNDLRETIRGGEPTPLEVIVGRAVARGELKRAPASARVLNLPLDLLRYEVLATLRPVSADAIADIVDQVWLPLLV